jgi:hypothetical protein
MRHDQRVRGAAFGEWMPASQQLVRHHAGHLHSQLVGATDDRAIVSAK